MEAETVLIDALHQIPAIVDDGMVIEERHDDLQPEVNLPQQSGGPSTSAEDQSHVIEQYTFKEFKEGDIRTEVHIRNEKSGITRVEKYSNFVLQYDYVVTGDNTPNDPSGAWVSVLCGIGIVVPRKFFIRTRQLSLDLDWIIMISDQVARQGTLAGVTLNNKDIMRRYHMWKFSEFDKSNKNKDLEKRNVTRLGLQDDGVTFAMGPQSIGLLGRQQNGDCYLQTGHATKYLWNPELKLPDFGTVMQEPSSSALFQTVKELMSPETVLNFTLTVGYGIGSFKKEFIRSQLHVSMPTFIIFGETGTGKTRLCELGAGIYGKRAWQEMGCNEATESGFLKLSRRHGFPIFVMDNNKMPQLENITKQLYDDAQKVNDRGSITVKSLPVFAANLKPLKEYFRKISESSWERIVFTEQTEYPHFDVEEKAMLAHERNNFSCRLQLYIDPEPSSKVNSLLLRYYKNLEKFVHNELKISGATRQADRYSENYGLMLSLGAMVYTTETNGVYAETTEELYKAFFKHRILPRVMEMQITDDDGNLGKIVVDVLIAFIAGNPDGKIYGDITKSRKDMSFALKRLAGPKITKLLDTLDDDSGEKVGFRNHNVSTFCPDPTKKQNLSQKAWGIRIDYLGTDFNRLRTAALEDHDFETKKCHKKEWSNYLDTRSANNEAKRYRTTSSERSSKKSKRQATFDSLLRSNTSRSSTPVNTSDSDISEILEMSDQMGSKAAESSGTTSGSKSGNESTVAENAVLDRNTVLPYEAASIASLASISSQRTPLPMNQTNQKPKPQSVKAVLPYKSASIASLASISSQQTPVPVTHTSQKTNPQNVKTPKEFKNGSATQTPHTVSGEQVAGPSRLPTGTMPAVMSGTGTKEPDSQLARLAHVGQKETMVATSEKSAPRGAAGSTVGRKQTVPKNGDKPKKILECPECSKRVGAGAVKCNECEEWVHFECAAKRVPPGENPTKYWSKVGNSSGFHCEKCWKKIETSD